MTTPAVALEELIGELIRSNLPNAQVTVREYSGHGDHFEVEVVCAEFAGQPRVAQHQLVYKALHGHIQDGAIHALALTTRAA